MFNKITTQFLDENVTPRMDYIEDAWNSKDPLETKKKKITDDATQMYSFIDDQGYDTCLIANQLVIYGWAKNFLLTKLVKPADVTVIIGVMENANRC